MLDQARKAEEALAALFGPSVPTPATPPGRTDPRHREALPPLVQLSDDLLERAHAELTQPRDPVGLEFRIRSLNRGLGHQCVAPEF